MTAPAKLPAYGKQLLRSRRAGVHPAVVTVVYGESWDAPGAECRLAVKPGDALGRDWRCVAGLPVTVFNRGAAGPVLDLETNTELLFLLGEIAREAAHLTVRNDRPDLRIFADVLAFLCRRWDEPARRMVWPAWWSDEIEKLNGRNRQRWIKEAEAYLARLAA